MLYRLMKKLPDGTYECVGYMKLEGGRIYHRGLIKLVRFYYEWIPSKKYWRENSSLTEKTLNEFKPAMLPFETVVSQNMAKREKVVVRVVIPEWGDILNISCNEISPCFGSEADNYIPHDRADQYTGLDYPDGGKVFENDLGRFKSQLTHWILKAVMKFGTWTWQRIDENGEEFANAGSLFSIVRDKDYEFTGIYGANENV